MICKQNHIFDGKVFIMQWAPITNIFMQIQM